MYLVSLYFDEETEKRIQKLMDSVARKCGNTYMQDKMIPPHLTIAAVDDDREEQVIEALDLIFSKWQQEEIRWVATGSFKPHVLFIIPVLNEYLHKMSVEVNNTLQRLICAEYGSNYKDDIKLNERQRSIGLTYLPFGWLPHTTIARTLSEEQMMTAFRVLQANFVPFSGKVTRVGLAKNNPHQDIKIWEL